MSGPASVEFGPHCGHFDPDSPHEECTKPIGHGGQWHGNRDRFWAAAPPALPRIGQSAPVEPNVLDGVVGDVVDLVLSYQGMGVGSPGDAIRDLLMVRLPIHLHRSAETPADTASGDRPATAKQRAFLESLVKSRDVPPHLAARALGPFLTHRDCTDLIPLLQRCPAVDRDAGDADDLTTPEGYDDSPDQGVHRYDGGGAW